MAFLMRQREAMPSGVKVRKFWLTKSGDIGKIRFLTDGGDIFEVSVFQAEFSCGERRNIAKDLSPTDCPLA